jgi:hypothetical protein
MSLLDNASLVLTPNAYKEGKLYSVIPSDGSGDFTFTRATTATRVNSDGLVELVPYNLVQYSEDFNAASWLRQNSSVTSNAAISPTGYMDADKLVENTSNSTHRVLTSAGLTISGSVSISLFAKKAERSWLFIGNNNIQGAFFNLENGTIGTTSGGITPSIIDYGNGWYRCIITATAVANERICIYTATADSTFTYIGDGTSGLYIWGAQIVEGSNALPYQKTETRLNIPRLDYSLGGCPNILLEPQRTNLTPQSQDFTNGLWIKNGVTVSTTSELSPDGISTYFLCETNGLNSSNRLERIISVSPNTTYTLSIYVKSNSLNPTLNSGRINLVGVVQGVDFYTNFTATNSVQRITLTVTTSASETGLRVRIIRENTTALSVLAWGAQLEAGSYPTSYIPTTTASVTRNADSITRNNIYTNGLITAAGGTWFVEIRNNLVLTRDGVSNGLFLSSTSTGISGDTLGFQSAGGAARMSVFRRIGGTYAGLFTLTTDTAKVAIKWNGTTADVFVNGVEQVSETAFTATNMEFLNCFAADVPKYINQMALFPTPLTDDQLEALTGEGFNTYAEMASYYNYTLQ